MNNPAEAGRSLAQILQDLRDFRASQPAHDLSVFHYRNSGTPYCADNLQTSEPVKRTKKSKRQVESDNE